MAAVALLAAWQIVSSRPIHRDPGEIAAEDPLQSDLEDPHFKISWSEAMGRRLRHNYIAIFAFLLLIWITKLLLHPLPLMPDNALATLVERASLGPIPGGAVIASVAVMGKRT